jgi:magnesium transporter
MSAGTIRQAIGDLRDEVMRLLDRHRVLTSLAGRQQTPRHTLLEQMQHRQNLVELQRHLKAQHPADIAAILDSLPGDDRLLVFRQLEPDQAGASLVEATVATRGSLLEELARDELVNVLRTLDADDLAYLSGGARDDVRGEVSKWGAGGVGAGVCDGGR